MRHVRVLSVENVFSVLGLPIDNLLDIACDPSGSRVLDVVLDPQSSSIQNTIPQKARRRLIMRFLESQSFTRLVDDRLGSRIADRCWAIADPYLRVSAIFFQVVLGSPSVTRVEVGTDCKESHSPCKLPRGVVLW